MRYFLYCRKSQEDENRQVLSIPTQQTQAERRFGNDQDIAILEFLGESRSAKRPGRPVFNDMLARIECGEADGIIAWSPDRLARNAVDGGRIIDLIDSGVIRDLKFLTYTFENTPQGKFMLMVAFAQSKYFSDALSETVQRGTDAKVELGWRPNCAPEGYLNDRETKTIIEDAERFPFIRRVFDMRLAGTSPAQIVRVARDEWGYLTRKTQRRGGRPLALSSVYKMLANPFYAGLILWKGQIHPGKHKPVVTIEEFEAVQRRSRSVEPIRPKKHAFAFTGLMRCASCSLMITAEQRTKPSGRSYIYYHCTKRGLGPRCVERPINRSKLEEQIVAFLSTLTIDPRFERWALDEIEFDCERRGQMERDRLRSLEKSLSETRTQLAELTGLRLRRLLSDDEFTKERQRLDTERLRLEAQLQNPRGAEDRFELVREVISMRNQAVEWFSAGSDAEKRLILETTGSNPCLRSQKLNVEVAKPFVRCPHASEFSHLCTTVEDVRTACPAQLKPLVHAFIKATQRGLDEVNCPLIPAKLKLLQERFAPKTDRVASPSQRSSSV